MRVGAGLSEAPESVTGIPYEVIPYGGNPIRVEFKPDNPKRHTQQATRNPIRVEPITGCLLGRCLTYYDLLARFDLLGQHRASSNTQERLNKYQPKSIMEDTKPKGGARPGAGRTPGSHNKMTREIREKAQQSGALPHELLLQWGRGEPMCRKVPGPDSKQDDPNTWVWEYMAVDGDVMRDSAKAAAPYYAPKISTVEVISGVSDADLDEFIARAAAEAGVSLGTGGESQEDQDTPPATPTRPTRRVRL